MNIIALHIRCIMQMVQSICKLNEDTFQLICIVSYDFWMVYNTPHPTQFLQFSINVSKLKDELSVRNNLVFDLIIIN